MVSPSLLGMSDYHTIHQPTHFVPQIPEIFQLSLKDYFRWISAQCHLAPQQ